MADLVTHFYSSSDIKSRMTGTSKNSYVSTESYLNEQWVLTHKLVWFNSQIPSKCFTTVQISRDVFFSASGFFCYFSSRFKNYFGFLWQYLLLSHPQLPSVIYDFMSAYFDVNFLWFFYFPGKNEDNFLVFLPTFMNQAQTLFIIVPQRMETVISFAAVESALFV